jgi:hypothetical protein
MRPEWGTYPEACLYCREMWARGSSLSRSAHVAGLVILRQTFVGRCHRPLYAHGPRTGPLPRHSASAGAVHLPGETPRCRTRSAVCCIVLRSFCRNGDCKKIGVISRKQRNANRRGDVNLPIYM